MEREQRLARQLKLLDKAIHKLVAKAPEFEELRDLLREGKVQLAIYVAPSGGQKSPGDEMRFELTDADRQFLGEAGIEF